MNGRLDAKETANEKLDHKSKMKTCGTKRTFVEILIPPLWSQSTPRGFRETDGREEHRCMEENSMLYQMS